jgi:hypothetical protein
MIFSLEHDTKVTKNHQNLLPTQSVLVAHTVFIDVCADSIVSTWKRCFHLTDESVRKVKSL